MQQSHKPAQALASRLRVLIPAGLVRFLGVGVLGLVVDLGLLVLLEKAGLPLWGARAISLPTATLATWVLNRIHTFSGSGRAAHHEALRYFAVAGVAQSVNYLVALGLADLGPHVPHVVAAFVGSVVATLFSYTGQRFFTFAPAESAPEPAPLASAPTSGD
jgi:putative flippase GtrA